MSVARSFGGGGRGGFQVNRVSAAQAREEARIEARMKALGSQFTALGESQPSILYELAASQYDDVQMMEAARDLVGTVGLQRMVADMQARSTTDQVTAFNTMSPVVRDALVGQGWEVPSLQPDDRNGVMSALGSVFGGMVDAGKAIAAPVKWGLKAMEWLGEEASRPQRVTPLMDSQRRLITETGMTPDQIMDLTGISTAQASTNGDLTSRLTASMPFLGGGSSPMGFMRSPGDAWKAVRTYWQIGHEGDDDYLATVQYEVYEQLEEEFPGQGKDALRWLKAHAAGQTFQEIAEDEGVTGPQVQPFLDQLGMLTAGQTGTKALARLESGRVSHGRTLARAVAWDWDLDTSSGWAKWLSGGNDAFYTLAADPTLVAGKLSKGTKAARWAVETFDDLHRWQYLMRVGAQVEELGENAVDLEKAFANVPGRGWRALRIGKQTERLKAEVNAVYEPARFIQEGLRTGDWAPVTARFPGVESAIGDIQRFDAALVAAGEKSIVEDIGQLGEFYKHALWGRSALGTIEEEGIRKALMTNSYKLFGHDGRGHFVVPHATATQRRVLDARAEFGNWFWGRPGEKAGLKALEEHADELTRQLDGEADDLAVEQAVWTERALSEDPAEAAAAREELTKLMDRAKELGQLDKMEIDPETLGYVTAQGRVVREQVRRFATAVSKRVPARGHVLINDQADAPETFREFSDMVSFIKQEPRIVAEHRYNQFIGASPAQRHAMVQKMIIEMGDATGMTETAAGKEILRKHIRKNNQAYGFHELFDQKINGRMYNSRQAVFTNQTADAVSIPSFRDMLIATRDLNKLRWLAGGVRNSHAEALMVKVWKPLTMFRMGFPLRAGADEALQFMARVGSGAYGRQRVLQKWAGLREVSGELVRDVNGEVVSAPQAAFAPLRRFLHGVSTIAGATDEAMELRIKNLAYADPEWMAATATRRTEILDAARASAVDQLPALPKSLRRIEELTNDAYNWTSQTWHKVTRESALLSRAELAKRFLKQDENYAENLESLRLYMLHPTVEHAYAQSFQHSFSQGASDLRSIEKTVNEKVVMMMDPDAESGARAVAMNYGGDWAWVGHSDLGTFMHHYDANLRHMANNPAGRAVMRSMTNYVPQGVIDEIATEFKWASPDLDGLDLLRHVRDMTDVRNFSEEEQAAVDMIMRQLRVASRHSNDDLGFESLPDLLKKLDLPAELGLHPTLAQVFGAWERLSPKARMIAFRSNADMLTTDMATVRDRMFNAAYNEMRSIREGKAVRKMVQGSYMDGQPVAEPPKAGHTRLYLPMIDRRSAPDMVRLLSDPNEAIRFGEALAKQLRSRNLMGEAEALWGAMIPQRGYDLPTWMAGLKAQLMQNGATYMPGGLAASSNYQLAEAVRDTFAEVIPKATFRPTIGWIDHPDDLYDAKFGVVRAPNSKAVVSLDGYRTAGVQALDPEQVRRLIHVEFRENGERVRRWVGPEEVGDLADYGTRAKGIKTKNVFRSRAFTRYDRETGQLRVNGDLIKEDWRDGMAFLKGNGGTHKRTGSTWTWTDPDMADAADRLDEVLDGMGLGDLDLTLHDLIGQWRMRGLTDVTFTDELKAHGLWDDFEQIAADAKSAGRATKEQWTDPGTAIDSQNVRAALDLLGVDVDTLKLTQKRYRTVIVNRAKAQEILRPVGGAPNSLSREAVEREMDALTYAWREAKLPLTPEMQQRLVMRGPKTAKANDVKILGEIFTNGVTEEMAVRRAAQNATDEVSRFLTSQKSNEPMVELIYPLIDGDHSTDNILRAVSLEDLPTKSFGPQPITGDESTYMQAIRRFYQGVADPTIASLARQPMTQHHFVQNMRFFRNVRDMLINEATDQTVLDQLGPTVAKQLRPVNELMYTMLKRGERLDGEDVVTRYVNALWEAARVDVPPASARREISELLAEIELGRPRAGAFHEVLDEAFDLTAKSLEIDPRQLHQWHLMHSNAIEEQVHRSMTRAIEQVTPFVDDHRTRSILQEFLGPVVLPFYYAEELFLRRFARGMYETPHMLRKGQLLMSGMRHMGVIRKDDSTGAEYLVIPGSDIALETMVHVAAIVTGSPASKVDFGPLSLRTEFLMPGWNTDSSRFGMGPLIGLGMENVTRRFPETAWASRQKRAYWEYLVPGQIADGYKLFAGDRAQVASAEMAAITQLEASGHGLPDDASATRTEEYLEDVRSVTRAIGGVRLATKMLFAGATPFDEQATFRQEFAELLGEGVSWEAAVEVMIDRHGPNGVIYTIFGSDNQTGAPLPSTAGTYEFMEEYGDALQDNPAAMAWLMPQPDAGDKFDYRAYNESLALGLRERRTPEEFINEIRIAQAAPEYFDTMDKRRSERKALVARKAPREELDRHDAETKIWKDAYLTQHPLLSESFTNDASERRQHVLETLPALIESGIGGDQGKAIKPLLDLWTEYQISYSAYAGQTSKAAKGLKKEIYDNFYTKAWRYVQAHPETNVFWSSVIEPELPDNLADVDTEKVA